MLVTFQVLNSHMWIVVTLLEGKYIGVSIIAESLGSCAPEDVSFASGRQLTPACDLGE